MPEGTFSRAFGSNLRIELGGLYVRADEVRSGGSFSAGGNYLLQQVNGGFPNGIGLGCNGGCITSSTLSSNYAAWQINLKAASDFKFGTNTLTPSLAVLGGNARNLQSFFQQLVIGAVGLGDTYSVSSALRWQDWGAKFGLAGSTEMTRWLAIGLSGNVGFASRDATLSANDIQVGGPAFAFLGTSASAVSAKTTTTPLLATAEANLTVRPSSAVTIRGFVGLNYDSRVPGVSTPSYTGPAFPAPTSTTPAGIMFRAETGYYAGGGLAVRF